MPDYVKTEWIGKVTPLGPTNLNKMEQGIFDAIPKDQKAATNGVATLDSSAKLITAQLPVIPTANLGNVMAAMSILGEAWELLATKEFTSNGTYHTFSGISSDYKKLKIVSNAIRYDSNSNSIDISFNGINSYYYKYSQLINGSMSSVAETNRLQVGGALSLGNQANAQIFINNGLTEKRVANWIVGGGLYNCVGGGTYPYDNALISSILLEGAFQTGSKIQLFGSKL
ncbi:hypothetical protein [Desulfosporosinus sp.]|uniref:hypothetical protein n=1 Tax=Desulfosporosinus sp. TaxID=157907 RepID=UPI0025BABEE1|nr:hypothetical protein [Desulfosporosinus sp.]MBC2721845.1 hypothetical protein [Desulfosporosinus sp.]MBC2726251.1 hypothetical protein [Desulfosporosinus sp.]